MIETDKRKAVFLLHQEGRTAREIARLLSLSRNTVRTIIAQGGAEAPAKPRLDQLRLDEELLRALYQQCQGRMVRVHEKLVEEHGQTVAYSTLVQRLRQLGIDEPAAAARTVEALTGQPSPAGQDSYRQRRKQVLLALLDQYSDGVDKAADELGAFFDHLRLVGVRGLVAEQLSDADYQSPPPAEPTRPNRKARQ